MKVTIQAGPKMIEDVRIVIEMSESESIELYNALYAARNYYREKNLNNLVKRTSRMIEKIGDVTDAMNI